MKVKLAKQKVQIDAPRELVFQTLSAFGKGSLPGSEGESSRVVERDGNNIVAEFVSVSGKRTYRTLENVVLYPPERITFSHLQGPQLPGRDRVQAALDAWNGLAGRFALRPAQVQRGDSRPH